MNKIVFSYRGLDSQGAPASGTVEAADKEDALRKLRLLETQGLHDLSIEGAQQLNGSPSTAASPATNKQFCGSCGAANPTDHRFCAGCGKSLGEAIQDRSAGQPVAAVKQGHGKLTTKRVIFLVCLSVLLVGATVPIAFIWSSVTPPPPTKSASRPSSSPSSSAAATAAKNERLEKIVLDHYRDNGVVNVEVNDLVMVVHVTPATYRLLLSDRVAGNKVMRGWQNLVAQNDGTTGVGAVMLYSEGQKVAEADKNIWSGEIKVTWYDQ